MTIYVVTGTRHPSDHLAHYARRFVYEELNPEVDELVEGEAVGIDTICGEAADERGIKHHKFGIERVYGKNAWEKYGRGVGHMRNALMVDHFEFCSVVGFWNGFCRDGKGGTFNCMEYAERRKKLWTVYFDNGMVWGSAERFGFELGLSWEWRSYGKFMLEEMYMPSRIALAHHKSLKRVEMHFQDEEKRQPWVSAAREGYNALMDGIRPIREKNGALVFESKSKKGEGHTVHNHRCGCTAAQFNRPCWARAAADILSMLENPPEYDPLT